MNIVRFRVKDEDPGREYLLRTWGADMEWLAREYPPHAVEPEGNVLAYWFASEEERMAFMKRYLAGKRLVADIVDNDKVRVLAHVTLTYASGGKQYRVNSCHGFGALEEDVRFYYQKGNHSCDCNRSMAIRHVHDGFPVMACGHTIRLVSVDVEYRAPEELPRDIA